MNTADGLRKGRDDVSRLGGASRNAGVVPDHRGGSGAADSGPAERALGPTLVAIGKDIRHHVDIIRKLLADLENQNEALLDRSQEWGKVECGDCNGEGRVHWGQHSDYVECTDLHMMECEACNGTGKR